MPNLPTDPAIRAAMINSASAIAVAIVAKCPDQRSAMEAVNGAFSVAFQNVVEICEEVFDSR